MGPAGVSPGGATRARRAPEPAPSQNGQASDADCRHGLIWDHTVFHLVASCRDGQRWCLPRSTAGRLSSRSSGRPNAPWGTVRQVLLNERQELAGVFTAYEASFVAPDLCRPPAQCTPITAATTCPYRCPLMINPQTGASKAIRELNAKHQTTLMPSDRNQVKTLQVDEQITRITTTMGRSAAGGTDEIKPEVCEDNGGKTHVVGTTTKTSNPNQRPVPHTQPGGAAKTV